VTPGSTTSYNFISSVTFANGGTCSSNAPTSVTVNPKPVATQLNKTFFAGSSISVPLSSNVSGSTYSYTVATASNATGSSSGNSNPLAQPLALSDAINWGSVTYVVTPTAYGCTGTAANTVVALYPQPGITSSSPSVYMGLHAILTSQSFYDSYNWSGSSGSIAGGSSISIAKADTYTLTVVKNGTTSPNMATITIIDQFNGQNLNYFTSNSLQVATSDTSRIKLLPVDSLQQSIQYFDGLGRTMQQVVTQGSPSKADVIQPVAYDAYGRQNKNYLPFTNGNNGWYKQNPVGAIPGDSTSAQYLFYNNGPADKIIDDKRPFNETIFESSAANRTLKNYGPGSAWGPAPVGNDKYVVHQYLVNQHGTAVGQEMVIAWQFNSSTGLPEKSTSSNTTYIATGGYYASNQLNIKVTVDENGNATREYSDKQGRVVLKKVQVVAGSTDLTNPAQWASTYYVYDDFGNLVVVLPPEGVNAFNAQN
jgi:hypothetical protein